MITQPKASRPTIPTTDVDGRALRRQVASTIAQMVGANGRLRPEHDAAAAAVLKLLDDQELLLTGTRLRHATARRLLDIADGPLHDLDLWDTARIRVELWLRDRAIDLQLVDRAQPDRLRPAA